MTRVAPLSSTIKRIFSAPNFPKISPNPLRPCSSRSINHRVHLLHTASSTPRHRISDWTTVGVRFAKMSSSAAADGVVFHLSPSSVLKIQKGDITRWSVDGSSDAIVNPANERMLGGGGADGAIHRAAGPELEEACYEVQQVRPGVRCPTGEARITPGFRLPASHVIHTVGPIYDTNENPKASLENAYRNSLRVAKEHNIQYIAFPAISCGVYGYPYDEAANVAISMVNELAGDFKEFVEYADKKIKQHIQLRTQINELLGNGAITVYPWIDCSNTKCCDLASLVIFHCCILSCG